MALVSKIVFTLARWRCHIPVPPNVEELGANKEQEVVPTNPKQDFVSSPVKRLILVAVDLAVTVSAERKPELGIGDLHSTQ